MNTTPTKILAICSGNRCRSVSLAGMVNATPGCEGRGAGTHPVVGGRPITEADLRWADHIFVFEAFHVSTIKARFRTLFPTLTMTNLEIPDQYAPYDPALRAILHAKIKALLGIDLQSPPNADALYEEDMIEHDYYRSSGPATLLP
jgi:predicted protein tyrosine phosphatase